MKRKMIREKVLSVILTAILVFSGTDYGNLTRVYAQENRVEDENPNLQTEETLSVENESMSVTEETTTVIAEDVEITEENTETTNTVTEKENENEKTENIVDADETVSEEIQVVDVEEENTTTKEEQTAEADEAEADEEKVVNGSLENISWLYNKASKELTISGKGAMPNLELSDIKPWSADSEIIESVVIEEGITSIGSCAFCAPNNSSQVNEGNGDLKKVTIPNTVESIGNNAFYKCTSLKSIDIPQNVKNIGIEAFAYSGLEHINITSSVGIGSGAFSYSALLDADITFADGEAVDNIFNDCVDLQSVTLRGKISTIKVAAFSNCYELTTIKIPDGSPSIENAQNETVGPFGNCLKLTTIDVPNGFKDIGDYVFSGKTKLKSDGIKLAEGAETIGEHAFGGCESLESITIPKSITSIGSYAFAGCNGLASVTFEPRDDKKQLTIGDYAFFASAIEEIKIPDNTMVGISAFQTDSSTTNLKKVIIGDNVSLGKEAFNWAKVLEEVIFAKNVTIDNQAFNNCNSQVLMKLYKGSTAYDFVKNNNSYNYKYLVEQVKFTPDQENKIAVGKSTQLQIELLPDSSESNSDGIATIANNIQWESSDPSVVSIDSNASTTAENTAFAKINALKEGSCTITVTCDGKTATYEIEVMVPAAASVTASPKDGDIIYSNADNNTVALNCSTENAVIYYTTDGSTPTKSSQQYSKPITFENHIGEVTIKAFATAEGYLDSEISSFTYTIKKKATGIELDVSSLTLGCEESHVLSVSLIPEGAEAETTPITWSSSNEKIASVEIDTDSAKATVIGKEAGTCTITATCGTFKATCEVTVKSKSRVSQVTANPDSGEVELGVKVELLCDTPNAKLYYTIDGTEPTENSMLYEAPITIDKAVTIKAIAVKEEYENSTVSTFSYTIKEEIVEITGILLDKSELKLGLKQEDTLKVSFQPENAVRQEITWESSNPTIAEVQKDTTEDTKAKVTGKNTGTCIITATCGKFTAECLVTVAEKQHVTGLTAAPGAGEVTSGTKVSLTCDIEGAKIYYTTDGTEPTENSMLYEAPITIEKAVTIKAIAVKEGYENSTVSTFSYTIKEEIVEITGISLDRTSLELGLEEIGSLTVFVHPSNADLQTITWISDNPEIAEVSVIMEDSTLAKVVGKKEGKCTITATCRTFTASCQVTVKAEKCVSIVHAVPSTELTVTPGTEAKLYCDTTGAVIYYTLDGTVPTTASTRYTNAIVLNEDTTIKAIAVKEGYKDSLIGIFEYIVNDIVSELPEIDSSKKGIWVAEVADQLYTGSAIKPTVHVYDNKKLLTEKVDYTVSYKNNIKPSDQAEIIITGKGNYKDKVFVNFNIVEKDISDANVIIEDMAYASDGKEHKTTPTITYNGKKLKVKKDFEVEYGEGNYKDEGKYELTIKGIGNYTGTAKGVIRIIGKKNLLNKATITAIPAQQYNKGKAIILPDELIKVKLNGDFLQKDNDYSVSYIDNVNPGKATVIIRGIGDYAGTKKTTFKIVRPTVNIKDNDDIVCTNKDSFLEIEFVKGGCTPRPILTYDGYTLKLGTDYTISYKNNKKVNDKAKLVINGKGNFKGKKEINFVVQQKDISKVAMYTLNVPYTGKANKYQSKPILTDTDGTRLKLNTDYTLTYTFEGAVLDKRSNPPENATITVEIKGKGNYSGSRTATYKLKGISFSAAKISVKNKSYTGKVITLSEDDISSAIIKVKGQSFNLTFGEDYEIVSYSKNIKKGTATVVICGKGDYCGEKSVKFKIVNRSMDNDN